MTMQTLVESERIWREIVELATPLDSKKPVIFGKPKHGDFEAYTDNRRIYINVDEAKFTKNFENIVVPLYKAAAKKVYDLKNTAGEIELLKNLTLDTFLFVHFHEQLHPWLCPNSRHDEMQVSKALYEGAIKAEPRLSKAQALYTVNNAKNLVWDTVLNVSFNARSAGYGDDSLEKKISFIFQEENREIERQLITHYPTGILPIIYLVSAKNNTSDQAISLIGAMYCTMSYNDSALRARSLDIFFDDLERKGIDKTKSEKTLTAMYGGFISELKPSELAERGIDVTEYRKRMNMLLDFNNPNYEENQKYFVTSLNSIFDSPHLRYKSLMGFMEVLTEFISTSQKSGSPDPNTGGYGAGAGSGQEGSGEGEGEGEEGGAEKHSEPKPGKSQEEMDGDSMSDTLDDLLGTLDEKEADDLLGDIAEGGRGGGRGRGIGGPGNAVLKRIAIKAADEFYKRNADLIELRNPSEENYSFDLGSKKVWRLVKSQNVTTFDVARMPYQKIMNFQRMTGLPVLMELGGGLYKFNEYVMEETPLKSYMSQKTGIEVPDNWIVVQDTSGSMTGGSYLNSGDGFDILNRVKYGLSKGLYDVCRQMGKDMKFGVVNFSNGTIYSGLDSLVKIYDSETHKVKEVSLSPQCGGTTIDLNVFSRIQRDLAPGKTVYTMITDGGISVDQSRLYNTVQNIAAQPNTAFVFIEIGFKSAIGQEFEKLARKNTSMMYYSVKDVKSIKDKLKSVLITYS